MTLRVAPTGVRLTVPARTPAARIEAFLRASAGWVDEQQGRLPPRPPGLAGGDRVAHLDDTLRLVVERSGRRPRVVRDGTRLVVGAPDGDGLDALVERWYRAEARRIIAPRAQALAAALGASVARVAIRDPRSRWGSCSTTGTLSFSWRLVLGPERILDYVVAHEVCHLRRADHSPAFWALLEETFPGHATARRWLRDNGALLHMGPAWRPDGGLSPS